MTKEENVSNIWAMIMTAYIIVHCDGTTTSLRSVGSSPGSMIGPTLSHIM